MNNSLSLCFELGVNPLMQLLCLAANEEYYQMLMINDSQPPGFDVSSYTIEEINSITSEYTMKNTVSTNPHNKNRKKEIKQ